jgi:hypothetical protein
MPDWFSSRVPLNPEDAERYKRDYEDAQDRAAALESAMRAQDLQRLAMIAGGKRYAERDMRRSGPVDQERSMQFGASVADRYGGTGRSPGLEYMKGIADLSAFAQSEPESRNVYHQALIIPEQAIMHASEALSGEKPLYERAQRLAMAVPAAVVPSIGYPVQQAYDRMYETNPLMGMAVDYAMPGLEVIPGARAMDRLLHGSGAPTRIVDKAGDAIRRLRNSPPISVEYAR